MLNKINIFNKDSTIYPLRWLVVGGLSMVLLMSYANSIGWRFLTFNNQEKWSASGPGSHK